MHPSAHRHSSGVIVLFSAFAAAVSAIWGYDTIACQGLFSGAISALMRAGFLVFVHGWTLAGCLGLLASFAAIAHWLSLRPPFRRREELLMFVLPVLAFVGGIVVGTHAHIGLRCSLHPWA